MSENALLPRNFGSLCDVENATYGNGWLLLLRKPYNGQGSECPDSEGRKLLVSHESNSRARLVHDVHLTPSN